MALSAVGYFWWAVWNTPLIGLPKDEEAGAPSPQIPTVIVGVISESCPPCEPSALRQPGRTSGEGLQVLAEGAFLWP